ncbi:hypothetical protein ACFW9F_15270 [Streptomyces sp. NPDC059506]|uniref:hypothetical protein n=1 Tax=Streptomyces TaxID=1883 RepID=UPI0015FA4F3E|nr:hypothetical protein [Streptomyces sp. SCUT-3]QMV23429.1 hypothetical protein GQS52_18500 [Streptomyces sp. SCUT-3]
MNYPQQPPSPGYGGTPPQPGPYGPPQPPGPYGQQPGPYGQQPYGGPQPGPAGPYGGPRTGPPQQGGHPQQGLPRQGLPQQQGFPHPGAPHGAPPQQPQRPRKKRTGAVAGLLAGALALAGGVAWWALAEDGPYRLATPDTVASAYQRQGKGVDASALVKDGQALPGVTDPHPVVASYRGADKETLTFSGAWGTVTDPRAAVDAVFAQTEASKDAELVGEPTEEPPPGFDGELMRCQGVRADRLYSVLCAWGDSSTVGVVTFSGPTLAPAEPDPKSMQRVSIVTQDVREDTRVPVE